MFETMPWDQTRDGGSNELAEELADLEAEAGERAFLAELALELAERANRPGLAKAGARHCGHGAYVFVLLAGQRLARCRACGHTWTVMLADGETDYLPADLPGIAINK